MWVLEVSKWRVYGLKRSEWRGWFGRIRIRIYSVCIDIKLIRFFVSTLSSTNLLFVKIVRSSFLLSRFLYHRKISILSSNELFAVLSVLWFNTVHKYIFLQHSKCFNRCFDTLHAFGLCLRTFTRKQTNIIGFVYRKKLSCGQVFSVKGRICWLEWCMVQFPD